MGRSLEDLNEDDGNFGYEIDQSKSGKIIYLRLGDKSYNIIELSAKILEHLKNIAEKSLDKKVKKAVVTVPAYFNEAQRQATKDAAEIAGLEVLRLINEPTAAALAYGLDKGSEGLYAVYDFGGGTFDVSVLKMQMGVFKVIATAGDTKLGGDDIDIELINYIKENYKLDSSILDIQKLKSVAKQIKHDLTQNDKSNVNIDGKEISISREQFESIASKVVDKTIKIFDSVLDDAELDEDDIKGIILVGGSTRSPLVTKKLKNFINVEVLSDIDPDKVVAMGAAIQSEALVHGSNNLLLDVTPLSLGLETYGGLMEVVIARNTPIPAKVTNKYTTYEDGQTAMKIHILQGEREMAEDCRSLANFELKNIPPKPAGTAVVEVTFSLDADNLLSVSAIEETTGVKQEIEVKPSYGLDASEMEKILLSSMQSAKDDITKRLLAESRVEAEIAIKNVEKALQLDSHLIDDNYKDKIINQIDIVKSASKADDRELIDYEVQKLDEVATDFADARISNELKNYLSGKKVDEI
jgi:molecular chaperone HscA